jgi:hypothetical protein
MPPTFAVALLLYFDLCKLGKAFIPIRQAICATNRCCHLRASGHCGTCMQQKQAQVCSGDQHLGDIMLALFQLLQAATRLQKQQLLGVQETRAAVAPAQAERHRSTSSC